MVVHKKVTEYQNLAPGYPSGGRYRFDSKKKKIFVKKKKGEASILGTAKFYGISEGFLRLVAVGYDNTL